MININVSLCIILIVYLSHCSSEGPVVDTLQGRVRGKVLESFTLKLKFYGFMGIPFAEPPVGKYRFLNPKEKKPWKTIINADKEQAPCAQYNYNILKQQPFGFYGVEDCLYLDIFTPNLPKTTKVKYPVIVFVYNELFRNSYNKSTEYGPDFFIEEDVLVVTISHRLSVLGFLTLDDEVLPGNAGLKDITLALKWIKENIQFFGGDDSRITLLGSQGGGAAVDLLIHTSARKLFHSAIIQSGTSRSSHYFQNNKMRAYSISKLFNVTSTNSQQLINELSDIATENILEKELDALPKDFFLEEQKSLLPFGPSIETTRNGLITTYPENISKPVDIPILIGFNSREGIAGALEYLIEPKYLAKINRNFKLNMPRRIPYRFDPDEDAYYEAVQEIKEFYFSGGKVRIKKPSEYITYIGDVINMYAVDYAVRVLANVSSQPIYYYHFDYSGNLNENKLRLLNHTTITDGTWGAATGDELCYLFKCPKLIKKYIENSNSNSDEHIVRRKLIKMWANFIKFGNPTNNNEDVIEGLLWKPYSSEQKEYLSIGKQIKMKKDLYAARFRFWDKFITKWQKYAKNGIITKRKYYQRNEL